HSHCEFAVRGKLLGKQINCFLGDGRGDSVLVWSGINGEARTGHCGLPFISKWFGFTRCGACAKCGHKCCDSKESCRSGARVGKFHYWSFDKELRVIKRN